MFFSTKSVARLALAASLFCGMGLAAHAQVLKFNSTSGAVAPTPPSSTCVAISASTAQTLVFDPQASGATLSNWKVEGDFTFFSGYSNSTTGTTMKFYPTGFGKIRVTVGYYVQTGTTTGTVTCGGVSTTCTYPVRSYSTVTTEFYKIFNTSNYVIKGPTCLPVNNPSVVYAVDPALISTPTQIQAAIGIDTYVWEVKRAVSPFANVPFAASGDGSQIIIAGADLPGGSFTVRVQVGQCNSFSALLPVNVATDIFAGAAISGFPTCRAIGASGTSTTFTLNTQTGVDYTLTATGGLSVSPSTISNTTPSGPQTITISNITATNSGNVVINGVGIASTCFGSQSIIQTLTRQLVSTQNVITPTCVQPSATGILFTLSNAPTGQPVNWTVPGGWSITSGQGTNTITVNTGAAGGNVTAQAGTCNVGGTGIISQAVAVAGPVSGCTYALDDLSCGDMRARLTTPGTCSASGNLYSWRVENSGGTVLVNWTTPSSSNLYHLPVALNPAGTVRVRITNSTNCLDITLSRSVAWDGVPCRRTEPGDSNPVHGNGVGAARLQVFPNPATNTLNLELEAVAKGVMQIVVVDAAGREIQHTTSDATRSTLNISRLRPGVYTVRVMLADGTTLMQPVTIER